MNIVIIDDDTDFSKKLKHKLLNVMEEVTPANIDILLTKKLIVENFDFYKIIFININLQGHKGIKLAKILKEMYKESIIVFTLNNNTFVFEALEIQPFFVIRKYNVDKDLKIFIKLLLNYDQQSSNMLIFKKRGKKILIRPNEIYFVESSNHDLIVNCKNNIEYYRGTFNDFFCVVKSENVFLQVHKSYVINLNKVRKIENMQIVLINETRIPIGKKFEGNLLKNFK